MLRFLPQGNLLDDEAWSRRHALLRGLLLLHVPAMGLFGIYRGFALTTVLYVCAPIVAALLLGTVVHARRLASFFVTAGLVYCSSALVGLSGGVIESHFHFFIIVGFIALYQDWVPFLWNILFTVFSHGLGSAWSGTLIFNHPSAQQNPWLWSVIHGAAVLAACVGMVIFWRYSEDEMQKSISLSTRITEAELERRRFTSDLLVNLARRNQSMLHLQLSIINQLEEAERDPDALADLFKLDHLATRIRRNAESLLVLSGEEPPRVWSQPVRLRDVIRAAIAETEDLDRVDFEIEDDPSVHGRLVTDLTHLLAELVENAVHFSPPRSRVTVRARRDSRTVGTMIVTVEDLGLGMPREEMDQANVILADPPDVDLSTSQRYGLHVVSRLAKRLGVHTSLTPTAGGGLTAVVMLPEPVFVTTDQRAEPRTPTSRPEQLLSPLSPQNLQASGLSSMPPSMPSSMPTPTPAGVSSLSERLNARASARSVAPQPFTSTMTPPGALPLSSAPAAPPAPPAAPAPSPLRSVYAPPPAPPAPAAEPVAPDADHETVASQGYRTLPLPPVTFGVQVDDGPWVGWWGDGPSGQGGGPVDGNGYVHDGYAPPAVQPTAQPVAQTQPQTQPVPTSDLPPARPVPPRVIDLREAPSAPPPVPVSADGEPQLRQRTPQSHLAPELRRNQALQPPAPARDAASTREALSQYQSRRQAALDATARQRGPAGSGTDQPTEG